MRITLTLDVHLIQTLKKKAAEQNISFKAMVHQTLQKGLESMEQQETSLQMSTLLPWPSNGVVHCIQQIQTLRGFPD